MSLYLKYRPKDFSNLVGQEPISTTLKNSIKNKEISHAYLFCGSRWTWKTSTARILAKAINSKINEKWEIEENNFTKEIDNWSFVDVIEIDAASNSWVDNIRELISKIWFSPVISKKKIYIIDEVHMLSNWAFNALLKTIEEPPEFVHFILATTEKHKVPETIISRCINFDFKRIEEEKITKRLEFICEKEWFKYEKKAIEIIAKEANWGLRDAISNLEKLNNEWELSEKEVQNNLWIWGNKIAENLVNLILNWEKEKSLQLCFDFTNKWQNIESFIKIILEFLREKMLENIEKKEKLEKIFSVIENFQKANIEIKTSPIKNLPLEIAIIKSF